MSSYKALVSPVVLTSNIAIMVHFLIYLRYSYTTLYNEKELVNPPNYKCLSDKLQVHLYITVPFMEDGNYVIHDIQNMVDFPQ